MDKLLYGLFVTALGLSIVFIVLLVLRGMIVAMNKVLNPVKKNMDKEIIVDNVEHPSIAKEHNITADVDENEIIAVITAAITACMGNRRDLVVRSITRAGDSSPIWASNGRQQQMQSRMLRK